MRLLGLLVLVIASVHVDRRALAHEPRSRGGPQTPERAPGAICPASNMRLRGAGDDAASARSSRRRARKRRFWRPSNRTTELGEADDGTTKVKQRRAVADGVQGVLVTANSFAESWRSRACHEGISLLSNAAQELLHMAAGAPCPDNSSRPDGGVAEDKRGEGGCSTNRLEEQRGARGRAPSKYRRIAEQAEDAFRECRSSDVVVDARGDVRRRRSDAFFTDQGPRRPGSEPPACGELRLSPMKVDLRGAVFIRVEGCVPPPLELSGGGVGMPESEGGALAAGTSESNTTDATDKGVVGLIKFTLRRILSAVAARSLREEGMQAASVSHWQSGHRVDVGRHVCKMIPIQSSCYASPQAAARLAAKLLPPFFGPTNRSALVTRNATRNATCDATPNATCSATGSAPVPPSHTATPSGHVLARAHAHEAGAEVSAGNSTGGWGVGEGEGCRGGAGGGRSFKIEFVRKCNSGAERDEYISSVAKEVVLLGPHHVNLTHPDVIVFVVLLRTACCMGVVDAGSYHDLYDFSLDRIRALDQIKTKNKRPDTLAGAAAAAVPQQLAADDADAAPLPLAAA